MNKETLSNAATVVLVACALTVTGLVVRRELFAGAPAPAPAAANPGTQDREIRGWESIAAEGTAIGRPEAPIKIVEFSDFQCPFCAVVRTKLDSLVARAPDRVQIVYRHLPLTSIHPHATKAAVASECAAQQGRFKPYHDALFAGQKAIGTRTWGDYAREAGVPDLARFGRCVDGDETAARVARDAAVAERLELKGTPVFLFDGQLVVGRSGAEKVERWVSEALQKGG
ncbi:MAG TPA: DsbA family protein [Longimicrobium sp.]|nr:DsbA family protein [Longimicrobium sp.]